jgi:hypothetical protein
MSNTGLLATPTSMGTDDDEVGWPPLRLLFNRIVYVLTGHVDNNRRRLKFNSGVTHER